MYRTGDPLYDFHRYDSEREDELERLPKCAECREPIQDERCFEVEGELYHVKCFEKEHLKWTDDYIE